MLHGFYDLSEGISNITFDHVTVQGRHLSNTLHDVTFRNTVILVLSAKKRSSHLKIKFFTNFGTVTIQTGQWFSN